MNDAQVKWCRVRNQEKTFFGLLEGDDLVEVDGSPFAAYKVTSRRHLVSSVRILVPVIPQTFYSADLNYQSHASWTSGYEVDGKILQNSPIPPEKPHFGYRSPSALIPTGENIVVPGDYVGEVHYEGELVAVIGKKAKGLSASEALGSVLGFTLGNDLSARSWQQSDRSLWRAKNSDTFKPMGPVIATGLDPMALKMTVLINGKVVSEWSTSEMAFGPSQLIALLTRYVTVNPGDVLWLGTAKATLPPLQEGDVVDISCPNIGVLRNTVTLGPHLNHRTGISSWDK
jgi:2-keto-4-pentenoate hydratase/2-oxohepta-3-ene-1,7-dioic acid hydratase in catechol pathway